MRFRADAELGPDGSAQIFIQPLLGCYSRAPTLDEALQKASSKILEYVRWLEFHGEKIGAEPVSLMLCERVEGDWPVNLGDSVALFNCDRARLTQDKIERYLRWMEYSWGDFQQLLKQVPKEALDWKPRPDTFRSIRRIIIHIALVQVWYLMKLRKRGDLPFRYPRGHSLWNYARKVDRQDDISVETLIELRSAAVFRLRNLSDIERERVTYHQPGEWTRRTEPEGWTVRKVFRRFLWHEKLHMNTIRKLLSAFELQVGE